MTTKREIIFNQVLGSNLRISIVRKQLVIE